MRLYNHFTLEQTNAQSLTLGGLKRLKQRLFDEFRQGSLIGKRIEARALALAPAPIEDPLAALDQLGDADEADEGLTFHKAPIRVSPDDQAALVS